MALQDLPDDHDLSHLYRALSYVEKFDTALDVGAHRGIWTRVLKTRFNTVIAFEPVLPLFKQLPEPKFSVAIGDRHGTCNIAPGPENTGQGHVVDGDSIPIRPLDYFRLENVDFLKLDVEGYELFALTGAEVTIRTCHPVILLEKNGLSERYGVTDSDIDTYLDTLGYEWVKQWNKDHLYVFSA